MQPYFLEVFANASAIHAEGVAARQAVETARESVARTLRVRVPDVYFTGSGTESNNLAVVGAVMARHEAGVAFSDMEVVASPIEHPSIMRALDHLAALGVRVHYLTVDEVGKLAPAELSTKLSSRTVSVVFSYVNSEIGVVQDVAALARAVRMYERANSTRIYVHVDAAQAPLWLPCALDRLAVDSIALDAGKCCGPKGVGILATRHGVTLAPLTYGGGQERGLRPATENVPGIVGAATALTIAQEHHEDRAARVAVVRDAGIKTLLTLPGAVLNGSATDRVANNINISLPGLDTEYAVIVLDQAGIAAATRSACSGADGGESHVVRMLSGSNESRAQSTLRFTLGEASTSAEIERVRVVLHDHLERMKSYQVG